MSMCVSYGISLCLRQIRIYLFGLFTFAKIPDNNIGMVSTVYHWSKNVEISTHSEGPGLKFGHTGQDTFRN